MLSRRQCLYVVVIDTTLSEAEFCFKLNTKDINYDPTMIHNRVVIVLFFLISMTENGWILNPEGPKGPFFRPDSYMFVKDDSNNEGKDKLVLGLEYNINIY